jgi:hypothetical protein
MEDQELESGYLRRWLSNGGRVNRDRKAPISMRAAQELSGLDLPTVTLNIYGGYIEGPTAPPCIPPSVAEFLGESALEEEGLQFAADVEVRRRVITERDASEGEFLADKNRFVGFIYRFRLGM